jgi:hypothetical protein
VLVRIRRVTSGPETTVRGASVLRSIAMMNS